MGITLITSGPAKGKTRTAVEIAIEESHLAFCFFSFGSAKSFYESKVGSNVKWFEYPETISEIRELINTTDVIVLDDWQCLHSIYTQDEINFFLSELKSDIRQTYILCMSDKTGETVDKNLSINFNHFRRTLL
jgi:hypothetical protein